MKAGILKAEGLNKSYGKNQVLHNLELELLRLIEQAVPLRFLGHVYVYSAVLSDKLQRFLPFIFAVAVGITEHSKHAL